MNFSTSRGDPGYAGGSERNSATPTPTGPLHTNTRSYGENNVEPAILERQICSISNHGHTSVLHPTRHLERVNV